MEQSKKKQSVKRTQKDYSMSFKLQVIRAVERGELSQLSAIQKYGIQDGVQFWSGLENMVTLIGRTKTH